MLDLALSFDYHIKFKMDAMFYLLVKDEKGFSSLKVVKTFFFIFSVVHINVCFDMNISYNEC